MRFCNKVLMAILLLAALPLPAAEVTHMFEASRAVINQDKDGRAAAFDQGLREVLVRVSGNSRAAGVSANAQAFVQQYRYLALDKTQPLPAGAPAQAAYNLWMQFDETAIKNLLRERNLPVWGARRPAMMMWLAVRDGKNRYILTRKDASPIKDALEREAARRGLPLIWPDYDAAESKLLNISDIWGGFHDPVIKASQRYAAGAIITGKIEGQSNSPGNNWRGEWSVLIEDQKENWTQQAADMNQLLASGVDFTTDRIASRFAVLLSQTGASTLQLQVTGINTAESYALVAHYLQSLGLVKQVFVTRVNGNVVDFQMLVNGGEDDLKRVIAIDKKLLPDEPATPGDATAQPPAQTPADTNSVKPVMLRYRLQG